MTTNITADDLDHSKPGWYFALMAQRTKEPPFAWVDPSRAYAFKESFEQCLLDLIGPFMNEKVDLVAGIDAMGFIMGAAAAARLGTGFLALRKAGHLCCETDQVKYSDYQQREKWMEIRKDPFPKGTRVLIVDQWIETGGTMKAATELVEQKGGIVAGIASVGIERSPGGKELMSKYKYSHGTPPQFQEMIDKQDVKLFKETFEYYRKK